MRAEKTLQNLRKVSRLPVKYQSKNSPKFPLKLYAIKLQFERQQWRKYALGPAFIEKFQGDNVMNQLISWYKKFTKSGLFQFFKHLISLSKSSNKS